MDAMKKAKVTVLKDLIKEMRGRMVACGGEDKGEKVATEEPTEGPEVAESEEYEDAEEEMPPKPLMKPKVTISLAAIKKGAAAKSKAPVPAAAPKLPPVLEKALMGKKKA